MQLSYNNFYVIQKQLLLNPDVQFAGYSMKSPYAPSVEIKIQTNKKYNYYFKF